MTKFPVLERRIIKRGYTHWITIPKEIIEKSKVKDGDILKLKVLNKKE